MTQMGMLESNPHQNGRTKSAMSPSTANVSQKIFRSTPQSNAGETGADPD